PVEGGAVGLRVRLTLDIPAAEAAVEFAERLGWRRRAAPRRLVRPRRHLRVLRRIPHRPGLEHDDVGAPLAQHLRGHTAPGARADNADVVDLRLADDLHSSAHLTRTIRN